MLKNTLNISLIKISLIKLLSIFLLIFFYFIYFIEVPALAENNNTQSNKSQVNKQQKNKQKINKQTTNKQTTNKQTANKPKKSTQSYNAYGDKKNMHNNINDDVMMLNCLITPAVWDNIVQPEIYVGNNMWRMVGSADFAKGTYIEITGRVVDSNCVPLNNAVIEIWQMDHEGYDMNYYGTDYLTENESDNLYKKNGDKNFVGSGTAITNNLGYYTFYTIIPGNRNSDRMPHINFTIHHKDFINLETQMFFPEEKYSIYNDNIINKLIGDKILYKKLLIAKKIASKINVGGSMPGITMDKYQFDITLEGNNKYKEY